MVRNVVSWVEGDARYAGYWIEKAYWGKGIATDALKNLLSIVTMRPLYARVARHNIASIRVLEKCRFMVVKSEDGSSGDDGGDIDEYLFELNWVR